LRWYRWAVIPPESTHHDSISGSFAHAPARERRPLSPAAGPDELRLPCDATQIGRFRRAIGEAGVEELLKATIDTAVASKVIKPAEFERVIVDTTVQEKAIAHPVDSRLLEIARHKVVAAAKRSGIALKQTFAKEGKTLRRKAGGYAHAKQFKRLRQVVKRQRTILGIVLREVQRKIGQASEATVLALANLQTLTRLQSAGTTR
jgi:IS5 family transposase